MAQKNLSVQVEQTSFGVYGFHILRHGGRAGVGRVGLEPTETEVNGFTDRCICRYATCPDDPCGT